jgi:ribosomal-protein-alanine acetyltransferase
MPIREMKEDDLPQVLALQRSLAFQDWNEKQFAAEIKAGYALCVVYEDPATSGNDILGYAVFHLLGPDSELLSIAVNSARQRTGIGKTLLEAGLGKLDFISGDKMFLEVREGNDKARRFYERNGFTEYSRRDRYYSDGENAILYVKTKQ